MARAAANQPSLFEAPPALPPGMVYRPEFVTTAEERDLAAWLETLPFKPFLFQGFEGRRQVVSFGWHYDFSRSHLLKADDVPSQLEPLRVRAAGLAGHKPEDLQQVLINKYEPGAPIGWHRDRPVFAEVVGVSLMAPCTFRLRKRTATGFERLTLRLAPRSAYLLAGPARTEWEHSIPPVAELRYSITFRNFRAGGAPA
ncbi:alpha-ketoglutarate-dependent dioxygenase AlkB [Phenylobacterium sp.]|uniref:alpha-ketoglutarate-dependent dioxygenase AlkB n=1 Tax=Phenylobacterium sp. TaxID=1871053 RepID=UPI002DEAECEA|nr:alpha-ketoglutarate-dependent dioxygenase AlkB [Phenylobacterium sp.]